MTTQSTGKQFDFFKDSNAMKPFGNQMHLEKVPAGLQKALD
jgi:hypothetical protein